MAEAPRSANFWFLEKYEPALLRLASQAERYFAEDPNTCLVKIRQFAEMLARHVGIYTGASGSIRDDFLLLLDNLWSGGVLTPEVSQVFHQLRKVGNVAVHEYQGTHRDALYCLRQARELAIWFHRFFSKNPTFSPGPFVPPPDPHSKDRLLTEELERLKKELAGAQDATKAAKTSAEEEAQKRALAEQLIQKHAAELEVWKPLAEESEGQLAAERALLAVNLAKLQAQTAAQAPAQVQQVIAAAQKAGSQLDLSEADTRRIIDQQLRDAGWEADSEVLTWASGVRPAKGKNLAIAEVPTHEGIADYALFVGTMVVGVVEAKRKRKDVVAALEQAKRYSEDFIFHKGVAAPGSSWGTYQVPFLFATIQGMIQRLFFASDEAKIPPVDAYDCIVIDECHRGYALDRELSDAELTFRSEQDYISKYRRVLDHFDAVKIGLTATPALHTVEIFGEPVYSYPYRRAVIDGYLVDHEPPTRIVTALAADGMTWRAGEDMKLYDGAKGQLDLFHLPDEVTLEVDSFNKRVITENFNRVVCQELAKHIDPALDEKTIVFCATDQHADLVVHLLKQALDEVSGGIDDGAVVKITGAADQPLQLIRRFRNERLPSIAVTVDLLTTGIDVPHVCNLVFLRRVRSRILYEQMMGRATRLCPEIRKERFRIFDAVGLYDALEPYTSMKPVVQNPNISFEQLSRELTEVQDEQAQQEILEQLIAKLQRKKRVLKEDRAEDFRALTGMEVQDLLRHATPAQAREWFGSHPQMAAWLDKAAGPGQTLIISEHQDEVREVVQNYGATTRPEDYLDAFGSFLKEHLNEIPALLVVTQRPRDLTRKQLKAEVVVDRDALDRGQFQAEGGFARLNKVFDVQLEQLLAEINEVVWQDAG